jgi:isopentenyl phosphate kinase
MNERIRLLAEQAGGYVSLSHEHDGKLILSGEDIVQKFAELIVKECGEFCGHDHEGVVAMFKHFGVE